MWFASMKDLIFQLYFLQDNKDLYAEEAALQRERERQRMLSIPGLIAPNEIQDEMLDSQMWPIFALETNFLNSDMGVKVVFLFNTHIHESKRKHHSLPIVTQLQLPLLHKSGCWRCSLYVNQKCVEYIQVGIYISKSDPSHSIKSHHTA